MACRPCPLDADNAYVTPASFLMGRLKRLHEGKVGMSITLWWSQSQVGQSGSPTLRAEFTYLSISFFVLYGSNRETNFEVEYFGLRNRSVLTILRASSIRSTAGSAYAAAMVGKYQSWSSVGFSRSITF